METSISGAFPHNFAQHQSTFKINPSIPTAMKFTKHIFSIFLLLLFMTSALHAQQEQLVIPLSRPAEAGSLELGVVRGSITVSGYDGSEVLINYSGAGDGEDRKAVTKDGLRRISSNSVGFEVEEDDNVVEIRGASPMQAISFDISVPRNFSLELSTVNGGDIVVENISGDMEISNVNGKITLRNVSGSAVANTVNGAITASFSRVNPNKPMAFSNLNGDIDVTLPPDARLTAKMKSEWGEVFTDFEMEINSSEGARVNNDTSSGAYKVSVNNWIYGDINGGGPEYLFKSMRGNIYIRKQ